MPFQSTVNFQTAAGFPGDLYDDGPKRAQTYVLNANDPANNIIGSTFYTVIPGSEVVYNTGVSANIQNVQEGGTGAFAGLLVNSKVYALQGTAAGTLQPTLTLPNGTVAEIATMGTFFVTLPNTAAVGDVVIYDLVTGQIASIPLNDPLPLGFAFAQAFVSYNDVTTPGLALITLTPSQNQY